MYIFENMTVEFCKIEYDKPRQDVTKQRHHFTDKGLYGENYGFYSSHAWMGIGP